MNWIKTFLRILTGTALKDEAKKHREAMNEAKEAVRCAKETLDGEYNWLWRHDDEKTCNMD